MGNNMDNFILEVEARLKNDGAKLTNELKSLIKKIENEPLEININHKKLDYGIADVKQKLQELSVDIKDINLNSTYKSFIKLAQILKQSATYSKDISKALRSLDGLKVDFGVLDDLKAYEKKKKGDYTIGELNNIRKISEATRSQSSSINKLKKDLNGLKLPKDLNDDLNKYIKKIDSSFSDLRINIKNDAEVKAFIESLSDECDQLYKRVSDVKLDGLQQDAKNTISEMKKIQKEINTIQKSINSDMTKGTYSQKTNTARLSYIEKLNVEHDKFKKNLKDINSEIKKIDSSRTISYNYDASDTYKTEESKIKRDEGLRKKYKSLSSDMVVNDNLIGKDNYYNEILKERNGLLENYNILITKISNNDPDYNVDELIEVENRLKEINRLLSSKEYKSAIDVTNGNLRLGKDDDQIKDILRKKLISNDGLLSDTINFEYNGDILKISADCVDANKNLSKLSYSFNDNSKAITYNSRMISSYSKITDSFGDKLRKKFTDIGAYFLSYVSIQEFIGIMKQGFDIIVEMDTQLAEMQKVSDESLSTLREYSKESYDIAAQIGSTGLDIQSSTADYMRLGKSLEDASKLAKDTNILMNVSEFSSITDATEAMTSMTQAYQELDSMEIIDKLNLAGNNYSISTSDLAQSLQKSSSALKTAKNDFDEAIALTVAGNSVVQDPDSVAAGIRTISLRMTGTEEAKKELEEMGESTDKLLTKSKLNESIETLTAIDGKGGISLLDSNGNYRSTAKVLMDLADRWEDIGKQDLLDGENRQNALLETLAGKNRSNILASILNDKNLLKNVYDDVSTNYQGSALKENERYMESIEGHLKELKNTWQEFWDNDINREFINGIIDLLNNLLKLTNALGGAKTAVLLLAGTFVQFKWNGITRALASILNYCLRLSYIKEIPVLDSLNEINLNKNSTDKGIVKELTEGAAKGISGEVVEEVLEEGIEEVVDKTQDVISKKTKKIDGKGIGEVISKGISDGVSKNSDDVKDATENMLDTVKDTVKKSDIGDEIGGEIIGTSIKDFAKTAKANKGAITTAVATTAKTALTSLKGILGKGIATLFGTAGGLATTAVGAILGGIAIYENQLNKAVKKTDDFISSYKEMETELNNTESSLGSLATEYETLHKGVSSTGENVSLTTSEFERYNEITQEIANRFPELISGYTATGKAIINLINPLDQLTEAFDNMQQKEAKELFKGFSFSDAKKNITKTRSSVNIGSDVTKNMYDIIRNNVYDFQSSENDKMFKMFGMDKDKIGQELFLPIFDAQDRSFHETGDYSIGLSNLNKQMDSWFKSATFDSSKYEDVVSKINKEIAKDNNVEYYTKLSDYLRNTLQSYSESYSEMKTAMIGKAKTYDEYYDMSTDGRVMFDSMVTNLSERDYNKYSKDEKSTKNLLKQFVKYYNSNPDELNKLYDNEKIYEDKTVAKAEKEINKIVKGVSSQIGTTQETIRNTTGIKASENIIASAERDIIDSVNEIYENVDNATKKGTTSLTSKELKKTFSKDEFIKIQNNLTHMTDDLVNDFNNKYYKYYDNIEQYALNVFKNMPDLTKESYLGKNKSFSELRDNASSYATTLSQLNYVGNDNSKITEEMYNTLANYGGEFKQFIAESEDGNGYIIKNSEAIKELIKSKQKDIAVDSAYSRDEAIKEYVKTTDSLTDLTNQLEKTANAGGGLDESILSNIDNTRSQIQAIEQTIQKYQQLEQQLLGTDNAFAAYNEAMNADSLNNKYATSKSMMDSIKHGLTTGQMGTETFKAAIQGMLSDKEFDKLMSEKNVVKRADIINSKYDNLKKYFKTDDDGNISTSSIQNFINDGYEKGLFTSKNLENFEVSENVTMDDFIDKLGYSKETIYSIFEMIQSFNLDWGNSIFKGLQDDTLLGKNLVDTEEATQKLNEYNEEKKKLLIERNGVKKDSDEWDKLTKKINDCNVEIKKYTKDQNESSSSLTSNVSDYLSNQKEITKLETQIAHDLELGLDTSEAEKRLGELLAHQKKLGEPTVIELQLAKDEYLKQLEHLKKDRDEIVKKQIEEMLKGSYVALEKESKKNNTPSVIPSGVLEQEATIKAKLDIKNISKDIDKQIAEKEKQIQSIDVALNVSAKKDDTYQSTVDGVNADKAEMEKDCKTPSISLNTSSFDTAYQDVESKKTEMGKSFSTTYTVKTKYTTEGEGGDNAFGQNNKFFGIVKNFTGGNFAFGSAFSTGTNYTSGKSIVGEFGAETIVDPWSGRYRVVGLHGTELVNVPKDAIVYNHKQTEQLFNNNKINSRGKLINDASGFMRGFAKASPMNGSAFATVVKKSKKSKKNKNSSNNKSGNSSSDNTKGLIDDLFDWIEIRLERLSNKTQKWITLAENAISKSVQKSHYTSAINSTATELSQNQTAKDKYLAQANALIKKSGIKNASSYAKKVREGSLDIQSISNEKIKDFVSSYKEMYDKAVDCSNAVMDLTGELQDLAESLYNLPIEHVEKKVDKYSDTMDILSAKYDNYRTYSNQNANLDEQTALQKSIKQAYASAYKETKSNLSSAKGKINSISDSALKGLSKSQKEKIVSYVNSGKEINISNQYSATLKKAIANYNAALEANRVAYTEAQKASAEYTSVLRENTNAKYENITAYYEYKRSLDDANLSKLDAKLSYRESMGYSSVSNDQKSIYNEMIGFNQDLLKQLYAERSSYDDETLIKQYENGELSREDYFALRSRIQEIDEAIYETTIAINEARDEIYNLNIKRLDIVINDIARTIEKFKNIISLKDSRNESALESDYIAQNKGLINQIENANKKREMILEEMKYYDVESDKYQELANNLQDTEDDIYSKLIELEENKNAIMELRFKPLEDSIDGLSDQIDDIEHLRDLLSDDKLINDNGSFTESGLADIVLIAKAIDNTNQKIADYRYGLEALEENFKAGNLSQEEFTEKSREYIKAIQDAVSSVDNYKDALVDLYSKQLEIENDALQKSITLRKEALQKKKDYYDYDKTLKNSNKDIVNLKNQIAALEGVSNTSAKAEVARLKAQLSEAEDNLEDTKYQHTVELQLDGYDEMSKSADEMLNDLLEELKNNAQLQEQVVSNMLTNIVNNYETAYSKIKDIIDTTAIGNTTSNSLSSSGENIANSSSDKSPSYSNISSSTIVSGNSTTSSIENSISNSSLNETNRKVALITTSPSSVNLEVGRTQSVTCTVQPSDAKDKSLHVSSSNPSVATASVSGSNITVTAKGVGSCNISISSNDGGAFTSISATVVAPAITTTPATTSTTSTTTSSTTTSSTTTPTTSTTSTTTSSGSNNNNNSNSNKKASSTAGYISNISGNISKSSSASTIKKVQTALKALKIKGKDGKDLAIDGKWGTNTDYAVKQFQKSTKYGGKITADGIIGKNTKKKFKNAGYFKGGVVDNVIKNSEFLDMIRMNRDDGLITAKLGEGIIPKNMMPDFTKQIEQFNSIPSDKFMNSISNNSPSFEINVDKFMQIEGNVDKDCVNDLKLLQSDITKNITKTLTQEFRKLGYK